MKAHNWHNHFLAGFITDETKFVHDGTVTYYRGAMISMEVDVYDGSTMMTSFRSSEQHFIELLGKDQFNGKIGVCYFFDRVLGRDPGAIMQDLISEGMIAGHIPSTQRTIEGEKLENAKFSTIHQMVWKYIRKGLAWTRNGMPHGLTSLPDPSSVLTDLAGLTRCFAPGDSKLLRITGPKEKKLWDGSPYLLRKADIEAQEHRTSLGFRAFTREGIELKQDRLFTYRAIETSDVTQIRGLAESDFDSVQTLPPVNQRNVRVQTQPRPITQLNDAADALRAASFAASNVTNSWDTASKLMQGLLKNKAGKKVSKPIIPDVPEPINYDPTAPRKRLL